MFTICIQILYYFLILLLNFLDIEFCAMREDVIQDFAILKSSNYIKPRLQDVI